MVTLKERIARHLPDHSEDSGHLPLVAPGTRTVTGVLPADGSKGYVKSFINKVGQKLPDYTETDGHLPLVAPDTRSALGELPSSTVEQSQYPAAPVENIGSAAIDGAGIVPPSDEVVAHQAYVNK